MLIISRRRHSLFGATATHRTKASLRAFPVLLICVILSSGRPLACIIKYTGHTKRLFVNRSAKLRFFFETESRATGFHKFFLTQAPRLPLFHFTTMSGLIDFKSAINSSRFSGDMIIGIELLSTLRSDRYIDTLSADIAAVANPPRVFLTSAILSTGTHVQR